MGWDASSQKGQSESDRSIEVYVGNSKKPYAVTRVMAKSSSTQIRLLDVTFPSEGQGKVKHKQLKGFSLWHDLTETEELSRIFKQQSAAANQKKGTDQSGEDFW